MHIRFYYHIIVGAVLHCQEYLSKNKVQLRTIPQGLLEEKQTALQWIQNSKTNEQKFDYQCVKCRISLTASGLPKQTILRQSNNCTLLILAFDAMANLY